jgi:hypothetical protein
MALTVGTNSYSTLVDADAYFNDRLDAAAWTEASDTSKEQALVTASQVLDGQTYTGYAESSSQAMSFPRIGSYGDPRLGIIVELDGVPARILRAQKELAYHLLNNDGLLDDTGAVESLKVGSSIDLKQVTSANLLPSVVRNLIKPLLVNKGSKTWWRAN